MRPRLLGHALMGLVSVACVCVGEVPYSLIPLAVFIYGTLPTKSVRRHGHVGRLSPAARALGSGAFLEDDEAGEDLLRRAEEAAAQGRLGRASPPAERSAACPFPEETFDETFV